MGNDWMGDLQRLSAQGSVLVEHNPMTPRYWRAETTSGLVIETGEARGRRELSENPQLYSKEEAVKYMTTNYPDYEVI